MIYPVCVLNTLNISRFWYPRLSHLVQYSLYPGVRINLLIQTVRDPNNGPSAKENDIRPLLWTYDIVKRKLMTGKYILYIIYTDGQRHRYGINTMKAPIFTIPQLAILVISVCVVLFSFVLFSVHLIELICRTKRTSTSIRQTII